MSWFRRIRRAAFVGVLLFCAVYLALFANDALQLTKAQAVVASLQSVRVGLSWTSQPRAIRFPDSRCDHAVGNAEAMVSNCPAGRGFWRRTFSDWPSLLP